MPSVLWRCWLGGRKGIRPVKTEWWGVGVVICLERGADLHMAQLMPLPLTVSWSSKIQIGFAFLVPAHPGSPGQRAVKRVFVCLFLVPSVLWHCWLVGRQEGHPACKNWVMRCWCGICLERGADCLPMVQLMPLPSQNPVISCLIEIHIRLLFWYRLTQVSWKIGC